MVELRHLSLCVLGIALLSPGCKKKRAQAVSGPSAVAVEQAPQQPPSPDTVANPNVGSNGSAHTGVWVRANYLGFALPSVYDCRIEVRDRGSIGRPVATGSCETDVGLKPGEFDLSVIVSNGSFQSEERMPIDATSSLQRRVVQKTFGMGRIQLRAKAGANVTACSVAALSGTAKIPLPFNELVPVPAGAVALKGKCGSGADEDFGALNLQEGRDASLTLDPTAAPAQRVAPAVAESAPPAPAVAAPSIAKPKEALPGSGLPEVRSADLQVPGSATAATPGADLPLGGAEPPPTKYIE